MFCEFSRRQLNDLKKYIKNYKGDFREILSIPGYLKFGCEVEFNSEKTPIYYQKYINPIYKVKSDISGMDIVEVISPVMYNYKEEWEKLRDMLLSIKYGTIKANTGGHIHFDHNIIDDKNILSFLKLWCSLENIIYDFSSGEFRELRNTANIYASRLTEARDYIELIEKENKSLIILSNFGKRNGLNLANHFCSNPSSDKNTLEVRIPNGSLNINTWQNNIEFFALLFKYANDVDNKDAISKLYKHRQLKNTFKNRLLVADMLYKDEDSKIRFLNQFELDNEFSSEYIKKSTFSIFS